MMKWNLRKTLKILKQIVLLPQKTLVMLMKILVIQLFLKLSTKMNVKNWLNMMWIRVKLLKALKIMKNWLKMMWIQVNLLKALEIMKMKLKNRRDIKEQVE
uniref:Uncharacterized protein n=1 Tax=Cacopsylla melanoneura TaxID=428564 RepID=A0A8D8VAE8_9HEMI